MADPARPPSRGSRTVYTARGGEEETYRPDFTFHAFRYMEITGLLEAPELEDIRGIRLHSDLPDAGSFSCSNELFNRIQKITRNTFTNNVISVQSDCPHRERFGYGGDIAVTSEAYLMNYDMAGFYAKTVRDFADARTSGRQLHRHRSVRRRAVLRRRLGDGASASVRAALSALRRQSAHRGTTARRHPLV